MAFIYNSNYEEIQLNTERRRVFSSEGQVFRARSCSIEVMRVLDVDEDLHGTIDSIFSALGNAVDKARDSNAYPILLSFYGRRKECECVDCVEGKVPYNLCCEGYNVHLALLVF